MPARSAPGGYACRSRARSRASGAVAVWLRHGLAKGGRGGVRGAGTRTADPGAWRPRARPADVGVRREPAGKARRPDLQPVSYTHLRAHETVLDLVCRLL